MQQILRRHLGMSLKPLEEVDFDPRELEKIDIKLLAPLKTQQTKQKAQNF